MDKNFNSTKEKVKMYVLAGAILIVLYWGLNNFGVISDAFLMIVNILMPFIVGSAMAFIFNVPMKNIEKHIFTKDKYNTPKFMLLKRILAYLLTLIGILAVITMAVLVVVPELVSTVREIFKLVPGAVDQGVDWINEMIKKYPQINEQLNSIVIDWNEITKSLINFMTSDSMGIISGSIGAVSGIFSGITTFVIGLVFSLYILFQKEKLVRQCKKIIYAFLPEPKAQLTVRVARLCNTAFANFISGQCLEAVILGTMFFIVMSILGMPYALLISVVIAVFALVPIVGAFIGCGVGIVLIALTDPLQAVIFLVLFLVLQQIEGNLIYPHVVGNSVGLPGMWVLVAVTIGGSLFGVVGMLTFIPICSVIYALFKEYVNARLKAKNMDSMENLYGLDDIVESSVKDDRKKID